MKHVFRAALGVGLLAAVAGGLAFGFRHGKQSDLAGETEIAWMQREFQLTAVQMERIDGLHAAYQKVCDEHCAAILAERTKLADLRADGGSAADVARAMNELAERDARCRADLRAHVQSIAEEIGGRQGDRYLAMILPRVAEFDHAGAMELRPADHSQHDRAVPGP